MKHIIKFFAVILFVFLSTNSFAEQKVVVLDMKLVLNTSKAGKGAQDYLQKSFKDNQKKFTDMENKLKKDENDLLNQKTNITKEEYTKKSDNLRKKVIDYQSQRRSSLDKIAKQRAEARKALLEKITPILDNYIKENNVSIVIDKKNVIGGDATLDITDVIIEKLNKELPSLNLK